jgi:serine/threonine protein kinase
MEYADCGDMYKLIKSQKKISILLKEEIIMNWFTQLCFAVKYIHDKKILHRDLKLSNVFLCSNGDIKLGDFGIAKILNDTEEYAKTIVGTPYYLSPEICLKQPYNQKSDIWSMGCILYEIMNLKHAFEANNIGELILKILKGEVDPMHDCFTEEMRSLVIEMLNTDCDQRPDLNSILEKKFMLKYIKLNLIRQLTSKNETNKKESEYNLLNKRDLKTRSNSSDSSQLNLNYNYKSLPESSNASDNHYSNSGSQDNGEKNSNKNDKSRENDNSTFAKIEKLKNFLENYLGLDNFMEIYFKINV